MGRVKDTTPKRDRLHRNVKGYDVDIAPTKFYDDCESYRDLVGKISMIMDIGTEDDEAIIKEIDDIIKAETEEALRQLREKMSAKKGKKCLNR